MTTQVLCREVLTFIDFLELRILVFIVYTGGGRGFLNPLGYPLKLFERPFWPDDDLIGN